MDSVKEYSICSLLEELTDVDDCLMIPSVRDRLSGSK
jgi:hypothetical protein